MTVRILVSNDDGIHADGITALAKAMEALGEVWVVAPETEQSATSHSLSLHRPLRIREAKPRWFGVDGTPADSVYLAVNQLMRDARPTLVVSGVNHGPNLADDVIYSGTVAAAMEAVMLGIPAVAFSLSTRKRDEMRFDVAARFAQSLVRSLLEKPLEKNLLLNVNVPPGTPTQFAVTRLGRHTYNADVIEKTDPRGKKYYWVGGTGYEHESLDGTDCSTVFELGKISISPVKVDMTDHARLGALGALRLDGFAP